MVGVALGVIVALIRIQTTPLAALGTGVFGAVVGAGTIASHIAADALTPAGVELFRDG